MFWFLNIGFLVFLGVAPTWAANRHCPSLKLEGFKYKATRGNKDSYRHANGTRLQVRCPPATITADDLINKYKAESTARNTTGDAVYFEYDRERTFERIYVITRRPTLELIFSIHYTKRARLNQTEPAVVAAFSKLN